MGGRERRVRLRECQVNLCDARDVLMLVVMREGGETGEKEKVGSKARKGEGTVGKREGNQQSV